MSPQLWFVDSQSIADNTSISSVPALSGECGSSLYTVLSANTVDCPALWFTLPSLCKVISAGFPPDYLMLRLNCLIIFGRRNQNDTAGVFTISEPAPMFVIYYGRQV